jgi:hypothetical protein
MTEKPKPISEDEFTDQVIAVLQLNRWLVVHFRKARKKNGSWMTPIKGDPGSPDILAARNGQVLLAELKVGKNKPSQFQAEWLKNCGEHGFLWYPADWDEILFIAKEGLVL